MRYLQKKKQRSSGEDYERIHENDTPWMKLLADDYCEDVYEKEYEITDEVPQKVLKRLADDKPGRDLVAGLWLK